MEKTTPSRHKRAPKEKLPPVQSPEGLENKYAQRPLIGEPNRIRKPGLGNLIVETTTYGNSQYTP